MQTLFLIFFISLSSSALASIDRTNPYAMIKGAADLAFKRFAREQDSIQKNPNIIKDIVREELLPYINYKYAAYKVIGNSNLKKSTKAERDKFVIIFREYLVTQYAQVFTRYNNQKVIFEKPKNFSKKTILAVKTIIVDPKLGEIDIAFQVRKSKKTKQWKAFDLVAEGISLLDSKRAELSSIIQQKGLAYAGELLKEKSARDIVLPGDRKAKKSKKAKKAKTSTTAKK